MDGNLLRTLALTKRLWRPAVSVIIPYYNIPLTSWFHETISSLEMQSLIDFEVILVDDGSTEFLAISGLATFAKSLVGPLSLWYGSAGNPLAVPIPIRIKRHFRNLGLSEARNTGVMHSKAPLVLFLDPDDVIAPTAIEKLLLMAQSSFGAQKRYRGKKIYFVYPGVVHFGRDAKFDWKEGESRAVYSEFNAGRLKKENFMTSFALIDKAVYKRVGGMCPRTLLKSYEDYDFWLRMETFGFHGKLLREPLFWYRRHNLGNSERIKGDFLHQRNGWMEELKRLNPVAFGKLPFDEAMELLRNRKQGVGKAFMPCYRRFPNAPGHEGNHVAASFSAVYTADMKAAGFRASASLKESRHWYLFPYAKSFFDSNSTSKWILYSIPWMVMGGADLYDVSVLTAITLPHVTSNASFKASLLVSRMIPEHTWYHKYKDIVAEIFYVQHLTNDTTTSNSLIDYLAESRGIAALVASRTVIGYDAIERWGKFSSDIKTIDILHLHHPPPDESNWEHRSARCSPYLSRRAVVSDELKKFLITELGYGDEKLGLKTSHRKPLELADSKKITLIPPPLDINLWMTRFPLDWSWMQSAQLSPPNEASSKPTLFFIGRFDDQKDPNLWLDVAIEAQAIMKQLGSFIALTLIGSGPLLGQIKSRVKSTPYLSGSTTFVESATKAHHLVFRQLSTAINSVLVMSSNLEGLPVVALESSAVGVPVVSTECGGIREIWKDERFEHTQVPKRLFINGRHDNVSVHRTQLSSLLAVKCENIGSAVNLVKIW
ncbi:hypothetical protein HDU97_009211 [Phlyctochytrium planicorne]|nr:hypothetical protein HDU97_009211 [Phlyctochytrium planicorne]